MNSTFDDSSYFPSGPGPKEGKQISEDADSLLYETYEDYFNMREETPPNRPVRTSTKIKLPNLLIPHNPLPRYHEPERLSASMDSPPVFFVLSATSRFSAPVSEIGLSPISPLKLGDIPEFLSNILPQPSTSLLEVININQPGSSLQGELERIRPCSGAEPSSSKASNPFPKSPARVSNILSNPAQNHSSLKRWRKLQFRDCNTAVPMSRGLVALPNVPAPSMEVSSSFPRCRPDPVRVHDPQSRVTCRTSSPTPHSPSTLKPRVRGALSLDATTPAQRAAQSVRVYAWGLGSSPLPIQFDFAPNSVPGSAATPYSYF